jgi:hypothetical protein
MRHGAGIILVNSQNGLSNAVSMQWQSRCGSVAIELHENAKAIEAWRATLPERQRRRLVHPLSNVRRWRASLNHGNRKHPTDLRRDAVAAWRRFVACAEMLPPSEAGPLWQAAYTQAAAHM